MSTEGLFDALDTCVISDAMDRLGLDSGVADDLRPLWEGARLAGRVVTVRLAAGDPPEEKAGVHLGARAIESSAPGEVIVVANEGRVSMGSWGGLLSRAAQAAGGAGVVTDGAVRDVDEARELGFAVFGRAGVPRTARGRVHEVSTNGPIVVSGITVNPGDWVVADGSGVVFVPAVDAERIAGVARELVEREAALITLLERGDPVTEVLGTPYESMLQKENR